MEAHCPPAKIARFAESEMSLTGGGDEQRAQIGLDLGLGSGFGSHSHGKSGFTFLQLKELEHQTLIFKYMAAGIPVPSHLVLPIWKSLANSYNGTGGIYPSYLGCRGVCFDYRNSMEPEPGRCRRTDGKKWRCSKDVVPDQKYCERHMHRGSNRSRKHVETSPSQIIGSSSNTMTLTPTPTTTTNLTISMPLQLMTTNANTTFGFSPKSVLQTKTETSL